MVHITNTLDTQNLKAHCNGIVNKHPGYTKFQGTQEWYSLQTPLGTRNLKEHCNGIHYKRPGYTESQGALQWYS